MTPKAANLQKIRDNRRTYAITPSVSGGFIKPEQLRCYADVAEKYGGVLKITSAQRIMITGLKPDDIDEVWRELGIEPAVSYANCVRSVKMCPGSAFCKRGLDDSIKLGLELDKRYHKQEMPSRLKIGVAGCPNSCAEVHIKDIGVFATENGWTVLAGGSCGRLPRLADTIAEGLSFSEVINLVEIIIDYYKRNADVERIGQMIDRIGLEKFRSDILTDFRPSAVDEKIAATAVATNNTITGGRNMKITKESIVGQVVREYPATIAVFRAHGMGCLGCPSASGENIEKAAGIHGLNLEELLKDLNKVS
jgi:hybrid cluster-associated redox disulfide protein